MKKFAIVSMFAIVAISFAAAADNANVNVFGKIAERFTVTASDSFSTGAGALALLEAGVLKVDAVKVGGLTIDTNSKYWKLTVASTNSGLLKASDSTGEGTQNYSIPYALLLVGNGTVEENWGATTELLDTTEAWNDLVAGPFTKRTTPASTDSLDLKIYYGAATNETQLNWVATKANGDILTYTDTVMVTAAHN